MKKILFLLLAAICLFAIVLLILIGCNNTLKGKMESKYDEECVVKMATRISGSNSVLDEIWWLMEDGTCHYLFSDRVDFGEKDEYEKTFSYVVEAEKQRVSVGDYNIYFNMDSLYTFVKQEDPTTPRVDEEEGNEEDDFFYHFSFNGPHVEKVDWERLKILFQKTMSNK